MKYIVDIKGEIEGDYEIIGKYEERSQTEVVKVGEPLPNSDEINKALVKGKLYERGFKEGYKRAIIDGKTNFSRQQCKTCNYYCPYYEQFSNKPRGDGYCTIARMTPEGMTTINCNDEFSCSDYERERIQNEI